MPDHIGPDGRDGMDGQHACLFAAVVHGPDIVHTQLHSDESAWEQRRGGNVWSSDFSARSLAVWFNAQRVGRPAQVVPDTLPYKYGT
ncbi:hypothetical protein E4U21_002593 [Claviceps maximensis]|nr:hypothetical protein E4U21_002593 [Claviceps maximensis]